MKSGCYVICSCKHFDDFNHWWHNSLELFLSRVNFASMLDIIILYLKKCLKNHIYCVSTVS